jgi:hypothetical protein
VVLVERGRERPALYRSLVKTCERAKFEMTASPAGKRHPLGRQEIELALDQRLESGDASIRGGPGYSHFPPGDTLTKARDRKSRL